MKTQCPQCNTIFSISREQLQPRNGLVRCGVCRNVFNALNSLQEEEDFPILETQALTRAVVTPSVPPLVNDGYSAVGRHQHDVVISPVRDTGSPERLMCSDRAPVGFKTGAGTDAMYSGDDYNHDLNNDPILSRLNPHDDDADYAYDEVYVDRNDAAGDFAVDDEGHYNRPYQSKRRHKSNGTFWIIGSFIALIVLLVQVLIVFRNQIVHFAPSSRPLLMQICSVTGCQLGVRYSAESLQLSNASLKLRPDALIEPNKAALLLSVRLSNLENIPVPWPDLVLSLKNQNGAIDIVRVFHPKDYLVPDMLLKQMAALSDLQINLPLAINGTAPAGYDLSIYIPDK